MTDNQTGNESADVDIGTDIGPDVDIHEFGDGPDAWVSIIFEIYTFLPGEGFVGLLLGAGLMIAMYIHSGDMALPTVVLILLSTALFGMLPGDYQQTAMGMMVLGITAAIFELIRRYVW